MKKDYPILKSNIFDIVAISLLGILIYSNSFSGPFIFDGIPYIKENIALRNLSDIKAIWDFWPTRFVAFFTFALNQYFNKLTVFGYHLVNFLIHLGSSVLVCYLARLIFKTPQIKDRKIAEDSKLICLFSALIFLTHPLQTQAVTYIYQRSTCLATFFYLASICLYLRSRLSKKTISIHYILSLFVALVGMFTKEILFTLPLMIILFEFSLFKTHKKISFKFIGPFLLLFFVIPTVLVITKTVYFENIHILAQEHLDISPTQYLLTQFRVTMTYLGLFLIPLNQRLDYDYSISSSLLEVPTLLSFIGILIILSTAILFRRKFTFLFLSIMWFFIALLPESSIITLNDAINEHRLYLPMVGLSLFLVIVVYYLCSKNTRFFIAVLFIVIAFYSSLAYGRNIIWQDELSVWSDSVEKSPGKARPYIGRGVAYVTRGQTDKAIADFSKALEIKPDYAKAYYNRGNAYNAKKEYDKAIFDYTYALEVNPYDIRAHNNRGVTYAQKEEYNKAIADFSKVLELDRGNIEAYLNRSQAYAKKGANKKARQDIKKLEELNYDFNKEPPSFIKEPYIRE